MFNIIKVCPFPHKDGYVPNFIQNQSLLKHIFQCHGHDLPVRPKYSRTVKPSSSDACVWYSCPSCTEIFGSLTYLRDHIIREHIQSTVNSDIKSSVSWSLEPSPVETVEKNELDDFQPEQPDNDHVVTVDPVVSPCHLDTVPIEPLKKRTYDQAVLYACQQSSRGVEESERTIKIVDALSLVPFAIIDEKGNEENVLAHQDVVGKLALRNDWVHPILPQKRTHDVMKSGCNSVSSQGLDALLVSSPFGNLLQQRQYVELTSQVCALLNKDWEFFPQTKFLSAKIFAGCILQNTNNGQAILVNTVEMYGRTKHVDAHREPYGRIKDDVKSTSLPPPVGTKYENVWPITLTGSDGGPKLVIGTQVSNALITSCIRLDTKMIPSVGSVTTTFKLVMNDSFATKIFLDVKQLQAGHKMAAIPEISRLSDTFVLYQLRQIRSKFHEPSAYTLCRESGPFTKSHVCQPLTTFTLGDLDRSRSPAAELFRFIGVSVLKQGANACISKEQVINWHKKANGKQKTLFNSIISLFTTTHLHIINNGSLNNILCDLAELQFPSLVAANEMVAKEVLRAFETLER